MTKLDNKDDSVTALNLEFTREIGIYPEILIVVGSGRCGTGFLARALREAMHLAMPAEEVKFVVSLHRNLHRFGNLNNAANLRKLVHVIHSSDVFSYMQKVEGIPTSEDEILERVKNFTYTGVLYATFQLLAEKEHLKRLAYKNPTDLMHMPLLTELMPSARFIHIIRDCRDVASSLLKCNWGPTNLYSAARYWQRVVSRGRIDGEAMPGKYFELRMEDLMLNTELTSQRLGAFTNHLSDRHQVNKLVEWVDKNKDLSRIGVWKREMNRQERYLCEAAAMDMLRTYNYPVEFGGEAEIAPLTAFLYLGTDFLNRCRNRLKRKPPKWKLSTIHSIDTARIKMSLGDGGYRCGGKASSGGLNSFQRNEDLLLMMLQDRAGLIKVLRVSPVQNSGLELNWFLLKTREAINAGDLITIDRAPVDRQTIRTLMTERKIKLLFRLSTQVIALTGLIGRRSNT